MGRTIAVTGCVRCKCDWAIPEALYTAARASSSITFYCPYGHPQVFREGPTEADVLRLERDRLKQKVVQVEDEKRIAWNTAKAREEARSAAERRASAARGQATRLKNRAAAGLCPCCNRSFVNLQRHMATKHKSFVAEEAAGTAPTPETTTDGEGGAS